MNLIIKKTGVADRAITVTIGDLIFNKDTGRLTLTFNGPAGKVYGVPLVLGPIPNGTVTPGGDE